MTFTPTYRCPRCSAMTPLRYMAKDGHCETCSMELDAEEQQKRREEYEEAEAINGTET